MSACRDDRPDPQGRERHATEDERGIQTDAGRIVELDASILSEPGLAQPAHARRIYQHQQPVHRRVEPGRGPVPEEEAHEQEDRQREQDRDRRPTGPLAQIERDPQEEEKKRQSEDQRGPQVVGRIEGPADLGGAGVRHHVVEDRHQDQVNQQDEAEHGEHRQRLAPDVLAGPQPRGMQQLADPGLLVRDHRQTGGDRDEEGVERPHDDGQDERDAELRRDPGPVAADRR